VNNRNHKSNELCLLAISGINYPTKHRRYLLNLVREAAVRREAVIVLIAGNTVDGKALKKELHQQLKHEVTELKEYNRELIREAKAKAKLAQQLSQKAAKTEQLKGKKAKSYAKKAREGVRRLQKEMKNSRMEAESFDEERFRENFHDEFVERHAQELNSLLPSIPHVNYHIAIAQDVFDLTIGVEILERLRELRDDVRLIGAQEDGTYDPEPKLPHQLKGFGEIRVILPRKQPWFYRILSSSMQRHISSFFSRTFSPQPDLVFVGCTGTAIYLPCYEGVPSISIPTLHKLNEQRSTENMVGCSIVRIVMEKDRKRIICGTYDFRPAIFNERNLAIPADVTTIEQSVLRALITSPASIKTILFRIAAQDDRKSAENITPERIQQTIRELVQKKVVVYNRKSNQYAISERRLQETKISLEGLFKNSTSLRETVLSCYHCGCLKTLYHTCFHYLPENAIDSDILVENGDGIQGIAHAYEYNGELLPSMFGYDSQERSLAAIRRRNILDIFRLRLAKYSEELQKTGAKPEEMIGRCLIEYHFQCGNHPGWKYYTKHKLILGEFEDKLIAGLIDGVLAICNEKEIAITYEQVKAIVERKVLRVGESFMVSTKGFTIGIKHPYKGRTQSKSHRIQDVVDFIWREFFGFIEKVLRDKKTKGFVLTNVANFHEAAAVHVTKFGRTAFGLMTGAQLKDTRFESHMDKVVDHGTANALVVKDPDDRLLYSEVEFDDRIHPDDEKICFAGKIMTSDVLELCKVLDLESKLPWRY